MYFDYNATCPVDRKTWEYISNFSEIPLNASSPHSHGAKAKKLLEKARHGIMKYLDIDHGKYEVIFVSSATEGNNMILKSISKNMKVYTSKIEHSSVYKVVKCDRINVDCNGVIDLEHLKKICKLPEKKLISIGYANGEIGTIQNMKKIKEVLDDMKNNEENNVENDQCFDVNVQGGDENIERYCGNVIENRLNNKNVKNKVGHQENNNMLHTDCTQAIGKVKVDLDGFDFITFSGHKVGAPVGIGVCVFLKNSISPFLYGGKQEFGMRAGTENVLGALGLEYVLSNLDIENYINHTTKLKRKFESFLLTKDKVKIIGKEAERLSNTVYFISNKYSNCLLYTSPSPRDSFRSRMPSSA